MFKDDSLGNFPGYLQGSHSWRYIFWANVGVILAVAWESALIPPSSFMLSPYPPLHGPIGHDLKRPHLLDMVHCYPYEILVISLFCRHWEHSYSQM